MLIHEIDGVRILFEDGGREMLYGDSPAVFLPGWRPVLAYTGLLPVTIVPFEHETGGEGVWFLDAELRRCGGTLWELPAQLRAELTAALCLLLDGIWQQLMLQQRPEPTTDAQRAFFALPEHCRSMLLVLYLDSFRSASVCESFDVVARGTFEVATLDCGTRRVPLVGGELHWLSDPGRLQELFDQLVGGGSLAFRSPCDGSPLPCRKSILLDTDLIAYKLHDETWDLSVFLIAGGILNRTRALYFPEANLVISHDPAGFNAACPDLAGLFHAHLVRHGLDLFRYLADDAVEPVHFWRGRTAIHLGHVLWNDYSGIERMLAAAGGRAPRVLVCDAGSGPELYGALDQVFPELDGQVRREQAPLLDLTASLYRDNALLFRCGAMLVTQALRERILRPVPVVGAKAPVLLLGLRTENRTATDLPGFCTALVRHLASGPGPVTLVVDGHNTRDDDGPIWSHGELGIAGSPMAAEQALLDIINAAAAGTQVTVVSTIGARLSHSLAWARAARAIIAFWGAGLAKYRWVCNVPGLVITSRWNIENLDDLRIYASPATMQDPSPLVFVSADAVRDRPEAPVMIRHGDTSPPSLCNFSLDLPSVMRDLDLAVGERLFPSVQEGAIAVVSGAQSRRSRRGAGARVA